MLEDALEEGDRGKWRGAHGASDWKLGGLREVVTATNPSMESGVRARRRTIDGDVMVLPGSCASAWRSFVS